jgi:hypothetical protein
LRGQCQLAARDKVELSRLAPDLQHNGAHRIASERVGGRSQRMFDVGGVDGDEKAWIKAEFGKPTHRDGTCFNFREILSDPNHRPSRGNAAREPRDEARRSRALSSDLRKHLVNGAQSESALQACIGLRMPEGHLARAIRLAMAFDAPDVVAQNRKLLCCAHLHDAPRPSEKLMSPIRFLENQKLAHLFMICSNIKLTEPEESIELAI